MRSGEIVGDWLQPRTPPAPGPADAQGYDMPLNPLSGRSSLQSYLEDRVHQLERERRHYAREVASIMLRRLNSRPEKPKRKPIGKLSRPVKLKELGRRAYA